jgi:hypothetical protein
MGKYRKKTINVKWNANIIASVGKCNLFGGGRGGLFEKNRNSKRFPHTPNIPLLVLRLPRLYFGIK